MHTFAGADWPLRVFVYHSTLSVIFAYASHICPT